ncbi:MAG: TrkH family potassium uptake protein [Candidatus Omnitrophica bacterium]|nr:TrkH family potassium uptake protein [Candidatus Omnitrophota bacterium]
MIFSPTKDDLSSLLNILGKLLCFLGLLLLIPAAIARLLAELNPFYDFITTFFICECAGLILLIIFPFKKEPDYSLAFLLVAFLWLLIPFFGALPLWFSGHFAGFLDAFFDSMSGFATTGLSVIQDLDHLALSVNFWRHFIMFLGGQGIIIVALSFVAKTPAYGLGLYVGEAREEKILPNIISTARFIWTVSLLYFILGSSVLFAEALRAGLSFKKALFHSVFLFMAAFDTGGFTPQSMNVSYYHSLTIELTTVVLMILGSFNFNLHYFLWMRRKKEVIENIETRTFLVTFSLLFLVLNIDLLSKMNLSFIELFRKGFYQVITAHTGCGFSNISISQLKAWPKGALIFITLAMGLGGGIGSTTGGIKLMRLALLGKAVVSEVKSWIFPLRVRVYEKYHHLQDMILEDKRIRLVFIVFFFYIASYFLGAVIGVFCGYPFLESLFESTSACANVGLSVGITSSSMPVALKITYIIQMWAGRLEFVSIIAAMGLIFSSFKK